VHMLGEWWMSELFEGPGHVFWNGEKFFSRNTGKEIIGVPLFFTNNFPQLPLEGHLWRGHGMQNEIMNILCLEGTKTEEDQWRDVTFLVYDAPTKEMVYEERLSFLKKIALAENMKLIEPIKCKGAHLIQQVRQKLLEKDVEGVILRRAQSFYQCGRSRTLYKVQKRKTEEAKIIDCKENFLTCKMPTGEKFVLESPIFSGPSCVGNIATFNCSKMENNVPMDAQFVRFRRDMTWENVLEKRFPFFLSYGKRNGAVPKCFGCKTPLKDRRKIRIQVMSSYTPLRTKHPHPTMWTFCPSASCIHRVIRQNKPNGSGGYIGTYIPPFDNTVLIPSQLKNVTKNELSCCEGFRWIQAIENDEPSLT